MILATLFIVRLRRIVDGTLGLPSRAYQQTSTILKTARPMTQWAASLRLGPRSVGRLNGQLLAAQPRTSGSASSTRSLSRDSLPMPPPPPACASRAGIRGRGGREDSYQISFSSNNLAPVCLRLSPRERCLSDSSVCNRHAVLGACRRQADSSYSLHCALHRY